MHTLMVVVRDLKLAIFCMAVGWPNRWASASSLTLFSIPNNIIPVKMNSSIRLVFLVFFHIILLILCSFHP